MRLLSRILAVVAASGIWLYIPSATEAARAAYPVWPSFLSTGCTALQGPSGSTTIVCGQGAFLLTQVNSGYECNQLDINVTGFNSGPFTATGTVNSGSQSNTISINDTGNYYMQFPGFLVNNLITIQISAPDSGSMTIGYVATNPCPVATKTDTPNPSFTATNTPVPVTGTPTAIPTYTPLPSGHNTFTPSATPTGTLLPNTATATSTPLPAERDCGSPDFPLLNCDFLPGNFASDPNHWSNSDNVSPYSVCYQNPGPTTGPFMLDGLSTTGFICAQSVVAHATGSLFARYNYTLNSGSALQWGLNAVSMSFGTGCAFNSGTYCVTAIGSVTNGNAYTFGPRGGNVSAWIYIDNVWVGSTSSTPTPLPPTATNTPVPGTSTPTFTPTETPVPIPGAMSTPIATSTECPGGCAVAALTAIPGLSTITTVDTSPFSQLQHLSLARNGCTAFGYVQVPYPVIHGTPALGSTTPLSVTWTLPVTHDWDNTQPFSNTAIEPCAMSEIPTFVWDFTYWLSVFACSVVFIMWLIGVIGRLSGDENING